MVLAPSELPFNKVQARMFVRSRIRLAAAAVALGMAPQISAAATYGDPTGTFLTEDTRARIRLEKCGPTAENLCGYVVWLKANPEEADPKLDVKNPDARRRTRPVLGHQLLLGLTANEDGQYVGKIYNNEDGKKYDVTVWLDKPAYLKVKGCLIAFLCSTQTWTRTQSLASGQLAGPTGGAGGPRPDPEWAVATTSSPAPTSPAPRRDAKPRS